MQHPTGLTYPVWVNWLAQDKNGCWWGFSVEPQEHSSGWYENEVGRYILLQKNKENPDWRLTLTKVS